MGVLNGTRRNSFTDPEPMEPGEVYELHVDLDATAWRFKRGHRIRLSISSADFPNLWPTPYNGTNRVYRDTERESYLELPVVPTRHAPAGDLPPDEMAYESSAAPRTYPMASPRVVPWEITQDMMRDRTGLRLHLVGESRASADMTVRLESRLEVWANNRNPAGHYGHRPTLQDHHPHGQRDQRGHVRQRPQYAARLSRLHRPRRPHQRPPPPPTPLGQVVQKGIALTGGLLWWQLPSNPLCAGIQR